MKLKLIVRIFGSCLVALLAAQVAHAQSGFFQAVTNLNPSAYWPMQETVEPPLADVETNLGSLGPVANAYYSSTNVFKGFTPSATADGVTAAEFLSSSNGSFLAVPLTSRQVSVPGPFSVEAWVYPTNGNSLVALVSQTGPIGTGGLDNGTNSAGWSLNQNFLPSLGSSPYANSLVGWSFHVFNGVGSTGGAEADAVYNFSTYQWYHLVAVFDGVNCTLYVNGVNATSTQIPMTGSAAQDTWDPLTIGCGRGLNDNRFGGAMNEVAVYTYALSASQIQNHFDSSYNGSYATTILGDNPLMYWRLDSPAYTAPAASAYPVAANYGSANAAGIYFSGTLPGVAGPSYPGLGSMTNAVAFDGIGTDATNSVAVFTNGIQALNSVADSGIVITNTDYALNQTNKNISAMVWFKANPADDRFQGLLGRGNSSWRLSLDGAAGKVHWNPGPGGELTSARVYNDGQWHFAVGVYANGGTAATGTNYLYVDGELDTTTTFTTPASFSSLPTLLGGAPDYVAQGNGSAAGYGERFFSGSLAHAAYFTNALTGPQVANLYTNATGGAVPPPFISAQPAATQNVVGGNGSDAVFGVTAGGTSPGFQWYYNSSSNYAGATALVDGTKYYLATTTQLTVSNLSSTDTGFYYVIITNNYGSVTSILAGLSVTTTPVITAQTPAGAFSLFPNQNLSLTVTASGAAPLTYQWYTNGVADTTAGTTANYTLTSVQTVLSGATYQCVVANTYGSATNIVDTLAVNPYPASLTSSAYSSYLLGLSPTAYWPMHENAPSAPADIETNHGTLGAVGNAYYSDWVSPIISHQVPGAIAGDSDPAVTFYNTNNNCLIVPHNSPLTTIQGPYTLEAWVKPTTDDSDGTSYQVIMGQGGTGLNGVAANLAGFALQYGGSPNTFSLVIWNGTTADYEQKTPANYPPGVWYDLVVTFDGTNVTYYVDDQQTGFGTLTSGAPMAMKPDSWSPLCIGAGRWGNNGATQPFIGSMDEVAVYTNVLTTDQINNHYVAGTTPGGNYKQTILGDSPLLYYRMDAPAYVAPPASTWPVLNNYGTVAMNGVYHPGATPGAAFGPSVDGSIAANLSGTNAMLGNGVSSFADAGINPLLNPSPVNTSFSYSAWFKGNPGDDRSFQQIMAANDGTWRCAINSSGAVQAHGDGTDVTSPLAYNDGNWHQVIVTCQETNTTTHTGSTNHLYVDGNLVATTVGGATNTPAADFGPEVLIGDEAGNTNSSLTGGGRSFAGRICEAAFFAGTVLSPSQVTGLYNAAGVAPLVVTQPTIGRTADAGAGTYLYFGVVASGTPALNYQWYYNSTDAYTGATPLVDGSKYSFATTDQVTVTNLTGEDSGYYFVVITNNYGSITSALASLTIETTPVFVSEAPLTYTNLEGTNEMEVFAGASPVFTVSYTGPAPIYYQWFTNGLPVGEATTNGGYQVSAVQTNFTIYCVAANLYGSATSSVWAASVLADPASAYPMAVLSNNPVGYWRLNEADDGLGDGNPGAVSHDYIRGNDGIYTNVDLGQPGYGANQGVDPETSALFGQFGSALPIIDNYVGQIQNVDFAAPTGTTTNFSVEVWANGYPGQNTGDAVVSKGVYSINDSFVIAISSATGHPYRFYVRSAAGTVYQVNSTLKPDGNWHHLAGVCNETAGFIYFYVDGTLAGSTAIPTTAGEYEPNLPMTIGAVQNDSLTGTYSLQFSGFINDLAVYNYALSPAQVSAHFAASGTAPLITLQPAGSTNVNYGGTLVVPAAANGTTPLALTWYDGNAGATIPGQTNATLVVTNVTANDSYYLLASNRYGTTYSDSITVTVIAGAPQIYTDLAPAYRSVYAGMPVTFTLTAFGSAPLYYKWYQNGVFVSTNTSWTSSTPLGSNAVVCLVSNTFGGGSITNTSTASLVGISVPTASYAQTVLSNTPLAYWRLNETSGNIAHDYVGDHDCLYTNVTLGVTGFNSADPDTAAGFGELTANNSFAGEINNTTNGVAAIDFSGETTADFSIEAWVKGGASQVSGAGLVARGYSGSEQFCLDYYDNGFRFFVRDGINEIYTCQSTVALDGNWHHLVGVCDELDGEVRLYVDGMQSANDDNIQAGKSVWEPSGATLAASDMVSIGARAASETATTFTDQFVGTIDEVAIYGYALNAAQVSADYQAGTASSTVPTISLAPAGTNVIITFTGTLMSATNVSGPFNPVAGASSPYATPATNSQMYYRAGN